MNRAALCIVLWPAGAAPAFAAAIEYAPPEPRSRKAPPSLRLPTTVFASQNVPAALARTLEGRASVSAALPRSLGEGEVA